MEGKPVWRKTCQKVLSGASLSGVMPEKFAA